MTSKDNLLRITVHQQRVGARNVSASIYSEVILHQTIQFFAPVRSSEMKKKGVKHMFFLFLLPRKQFFLGLLGIRSMSVTNQ